MISWATAPQVNPAFLPQSRARDRRVNKFQPFGGQSGYAQHFLAIYAVGAENALLHPHLAHLFQDVSAENRIASKLSSG